MGKLLRLLAQASMCLAFMLPLAARAQAASCNDGQPVRLADLNWESASFTTHVVRKLLAAGYGCATEIVPGASAAIESALAQDDLQVVAEIWSGRSSIIEEAIHQGKIAIVGDTLAGGAEQGWYVPDYVVHGAPERGIEASAPDLRGWRDLARYRSLFTDPEDPRKGRFLNCPSGWVCEKTNSRLLQLHGLDDAYTNFRAGTGAALDAAVSSAYDRGRPILFYYWQPAGLMAKYKFYKIEQDPFDQKCWDAIVSGKGQPCSSDFLRARLSVAVSVPFANRNPGIMAFFEKLQFEPPLLNRMILEMTETRKSGADMADQFLREYPDVWRAWLPADVSARVSASLGTDAPKARAGAPAPTGAAAAAGGGIFPDWSAAAFVNRQLMDVVKEYGGVFRRASDIMLTGLLLPVERLMLAIPPWAFLLLVAALSWHATRKAGSAMLYAACLYLVGAVGLWDKLIQTFALVSVSTLVSIVLGLPIGILAARSQLLRRVLTPVLDVMQTLPGFVYLIPVLMLFGLGKVPALFATIIYAMPPLIRLTLLGLRQVDPDIMEAAQAFGVTRWQMLTRVALPLARPSIMAGINQATMMALAMVVVASMIGARGLGEDVLAGIQTLDVGHGLQAGVAIVILAIVIDRITQAYGRPRRRRPASLREKL
jgi:glycine betaine/proline transport system substrate-binding protein